MTSMRLDPSRGHGAQSTQVQSSSSKASTGLFHDLTAGRFGPVKPKLVAGNPEIDLLYLKQQQLLGFNGLMVVDHLCMIAWHSKLFWLRSHTLQDWRARLTEKLWNAHGIGQDNGSSESRGNIAILCNLNNFNSNTIPPSINLTLSHLNDHSWHLASKTYQKHVTAAEFGWNSTFKFVSYAVDVLANQACTWDCGSQPRLETAKLHHCLRQTRLTHGHQEHRKGHMMLYTSLPQQ